MHAVILHLSRYISRRVKRLAGLPLLIKEINFTVTTQENLGHQHIGFDRLKRKLLLVKKRGNRLVCCILNLQDLQWCSVKKVYSAIGADELKKQGLSHHLQQVTLQLGFKGRSKPVSVSFFENRQNSAEDLLLLEAAAKRWERFLSQLVPATLPALPV